MAGIAGARGSNADLQGMLTSLKHRGPYQNWLSDGKGPRVGCCLLPSEATSNDRVFAVRDDITAVLDGHVYDTEASQTGDANLLLSLYEKYGSRFPEVLDGDFACAIAHGDELIVARDAVGLRPLYYASQDGNFYFASEAKALHSIDHDIKEFPPTHIYTTTNGLKEYSTSYEDITDFDNPDQAAQILASRLEQAIDKRMADGLAEGVLLSGGLDSSIIACLAREHRSDLKTFTVGIGDGEDRDYARELAHQLGTKHYEYTYTEAEIAKMLPQVIYHLESFEEDCVKGAVANYFAARLASQYTGCVLTGEGSDEFLGGYHEVKRAKDEKELQQMLDHLVDIAYNTGLQRLDRMMAAHSLEFRTPFLDRAVVALCRRIPTQWKIYGPDQIEKWILRRAFSDRLPEHIVWRIKQPFGTGAGSSKLMSAIAVGPSESFRGEIGADKNVKLASAEEQRYYQIFKQSFPQPSLARLVARWDPAKADFGL